MKPELIIRITLIILSTGMFITTIEKIRTYHLYLNSGILSWQTSKSRFKWTMQGWSSKFLNYLLNERSFKIVLYLTAISCLLSSLCIFKTVNLLVSIPLSIFMILYFIRNVYGTDGADQMNFVILISLVLFGVLKTDSIIINLPIYFIAFQLLLSYLISGFSKIISEEWRSGTALIGILSTQAYGDILFHRMLSNNLKLSRILCWLVILFELLFPIVLLLSFKTQIIIILLGVLFHLGIAIIMGLNNFLFAFLAAYPSLYFTLQNIS